MSDYDTENLGAIKNHVPDKEISQITLSNLQAYDEAALVARTGVPKDPSLKPTTRNERVENRFAALRKMVGIQAHIVSGHNMATIGENCYHNWEKKYKTEQERKEHPFNDEENDLNEWIDLLKDLEEFDKKIDMAEMTRTLEDDYILEKEDGQGNIRKVLSTHFYNMFNVLIASYRYVYGCLIKHKIVTLGVSEDADITEREKELEAMRRITSA